jgi:formylglycine-generating enzyme required for sulfatase activity
MKRNYVLIIVALAAAVCLTWTAAVNAESITTREYWILTDGYRGEFTNGGQMTMTHGAYPPYIAEDVFDIDWPGSTGTTDQFFKYSGGKLIYYGAKFVDSSEWMYVPDSPQAFLPAVVQIGGIYKCSWSRKEYQNDFPKGYGSDSYTIVVSGPTAVTVPAGTFTTYEFRLTNNWRTSSGDTGTSYYTYFLAKGIGWIKLIREGVTYDLLKAPPTAVTGAATAITTSSATLNGTVNPRGASTTVVFEYGTTTAYGKQVAAAQSPLSGATSQAVSAQATGLSEGTLYHFRVKASNSQGTVWGSDGTFTTRQELPPTVKTHYPSNLTRTSATLNAEVNPNGLDTTWHFEYGTSDACDSSTPNQSGGSGSASQPVSRSLTGLTPDTTYYYRIAAENIKGESPGGIQTLRTTVLYVEPFGACGGHTPCYGSIQHAAEAAVYGGTLKIADDDFYEDLEPGTWGNLILEGGWNASFSSRSAISATSGTAIEGALLIGSDMHGVVLVDGLILTGGSAPAPVKPTVITGSASDITTNSATLNGTVNPKGLSTTYYFQYGKSTSYGTNTTSKSAGSGTSAVPVNAPISGLTPGVTYHFRLIGTNTAGTSYGSDITFTTSSPPSTYTNSLGQTFKLLPAGTFTMGSPSDELGRDSDEGPQHQVTLTKSFYMQTTEVTQAQWEAVMGSNPSYFLGCPTCPVEQVSWNDVQTFITEMNKRGEGTYSLPTEAQWEYAARAGSITAFYNGGITVTDCSYDPNLDKIGWYCYNSSNKTHPVAQKTQNAWGLYDMSGNVWEWCQDWYSSSYYSSSPGSDPTGPSSGSNRVLRGGGWGSGARGCRSADRNSSTPGSRSSIFGFRLLRQP